LESQYLDPPLFHHQSYQGLPVSEIHRKRGDGRRPARSGVKKQKGSVLPVDEYLNSRLSACKEMMG
jgi:hypothetical protein